MNQPGTNLARLADAMHAPSTGDYVAERHPLFPNIILVWAPCGCYYVADRTDSFVTGCAKEGCSFSWTQVAVALEALHQAELSIPKETTGGPIPVAADSSRIDVAAEVAPEVEIEAVTNMISEGGPVDTQV